MQRWYLGANASLTRESPTTGDSADHLADTSPPLERDVHFPSVLIRKGHRIRILIARHDAGTFVRIPAQGPPTITLERNRERPSCIDLPMRERPV